MMTAGVLFATKSISFSDIRVILRIASATGNHHRRIESENEDATNRQTRIYLMLGNYGNSNIGDETLLKATIKDLRKTNGENIACLIPTRNPNFVHIYHKTDAHLIESLPINAPSLILKGFIKCHTIVVGGGGIWSGYTGPLAHFIPVITILGKVLGKKVEFRAVGLYSTAHIFDRVLVNIAILLADSCSVRDKESYQLLWKINRSKTKQVDDLAIGYLRSISPEDFASVRAQSKWKDALSSLKESDKIIIGLSVKPIKNRETNERILSQFSEAISTLDATYPGRLHFVFFPFAKTGSKVESDEELVRIIADRVSRSCNITTLDHSDPLSWFIAIRDYVDIFVGMRFHSIIFASEARKPVLCIPYERKITEFLKSREDDPNISSTAPEDLDASAIVNFVDGYVKMIARQE
jgi:polysaccharide pyruvyl transferase WcaK-like protein